ncbi:hypothetical protein SAMN04487949_3618 [Halogranum gelatinilyticum]|uniref:Uncharacterized protein n=1 Tax=Halogranum gelatinilyticum TaxID=660521 RepID=A0A1G9ZDX8_9EURY|nr:hypothetical protein [Halogranum gelatinilyticum]SDN19385.1 hypothetical protein SAMN04487949_3618 [Halogranum gelatinilyticum]
MSPHGRRDSASLSQCFEPWHYTYLRLPQRASWGLRNLLRARSPVHYVAGDMRRDYGWTRTLLAAGATLAGFAFTVRLLLTGVFVALASPSPVAIVLFNLSLSFLLGRTLLARLDTEPRTRRRVVSARTWWVRAARRRPRDRQPLSLDHQSLSLDRHRAYSSRRPTAEHEQPRRRP